MPDSPTYCTADDVRTYSNHPDFMEEVGEEYVITDEQLEAKIIIAEVYVDREAKYWMREGGTSQARVFPRMEDGQYTGQSGQIPEAIKFATIAQVEHMHVNMPDVDHGIEPDAKPTSVSISPRARELIRGGYRRTTGSITLPQAQDPATI